MKENVDKALALVKNRRDNIKPENIRKDIVVFNTKGQMNPLDGEEREGYPSERGYMIKPNELAGANGITKIKMKGIKNMQEQFLKPRYIKRGITLFGVEGTLDIFNPEIEENKIFTTDKSDYYRILPQDDYDGFNEIAISVKVPPAEGQIMDTTDGTATEKDILFGKGAYVKGKGVVGNLQTTTNITKEATVQNLKEQKKITVKASQSKDEVIEKDGQIIETVPYQDITEQIELTPEKVAIGEEILGVKGIGDPKWKLQKQKDYYINYNCEGMFDVPYKIYPDNELQGMQKIVIHNDNFFNIPVNFPCPWIEADFLEDFSESSIVGLQVSAFEEKSKKIKIPFSEIPADEEIIGMNLTDIREKKDEILAPFIVITQKQIGAEKYQSQLFLYSYAYNEETNFTFLNKKMIFDFGEYFGRYTSTSIKEKSYAVRLCGCHNNNHIFAIELTSGEMIIIEDIDEPIHQEPTYNGFRVFSVYPNIDNTIANSWRVSFFQDYFLISRITRNEKTNALILKQEFETVLHQLGHNDFTITSPTEKTPYHLISGSTEDVNWTNIPESYIVNDKSFTLTHKWNKDNFLFPFPNNDHAYYMRINHAYSSEEPNYMEGMVSLGSEVQKIDEANTIDYFLNLKDSFENNYFRDSFGNITIMLIKEGVDIPPKLLLQKVKRIPIWNYSGYRNILTTPKYTVNYPFYSNHLAIGEDGLIKINNDFILDNNSITGISCSEDLLFMIVKKGEKEYLFKKRCFPAKFKAGPFFNGLEVFYNEKGEILENLEVMKTYLENGPEEIFIGYEFIQVLPGKDFRFLSEFTPGIGNERIIIQEHNFKDAYFIPYSSPIIKAKPFYNKDGTLNSQIEGVGFTTKGYKKGDRGRVRIMTINPYYGTEQQDAYIPDFGEEGDEENGHSSTES